MTKTKTPRPAKRLSPEAYDALKTTALLEVEDLLRRCLELEAAR